MSLEVDSIVRQAGADVGMNPEDKVLDQICTSLKSEFIVHEWQLGLLDSAQWQRLGAPMGVAVAIQALVSESKEIQQQELFAKIEVPQFSSGLTSRSSAAIGRNDMLSSSIRSDGSIRKSYRPTHTMNGHMPFHRSKARGTEKKKTEPSVDVLEEENDIDAGDNNDDDDDDDSDNSAIVRKETDDNLKPMTSDVQKCNGACVATCFSDMMNVHIPVDSSCFVMSKTFNQALLHAKSGADLKAHTMFVVELSVVASALFLGAAIELWGAFPVDSVTSGPLSEGGVPEALAIAFNTTSSLLIISQLICASSWIWSLRVISAVAPNKFHQYVVETRHFSNYINGMSVFGFFLFAIDLFLLLTGMCMAVTSSWITNAVVLAVVLAVFFAGSIMSHKITSFLGRVAYHGMLMMEQLPFSDDSSVAKPEETHFKRREDMLHRLFERHAIRNEDKALDTYSQVSHPCIADP